MGDIPGRGDVAAVAVADVVGDEPGAGDHPGDGFPVGPVDQLLALARPLEHGQHQQAAEGVEVRVGVVAAALGEAAVLVQQVLEVEVGEALRLLEGGRLPGGGVETEQPLDGAAVGVGRGGAVAVLGQRRSAVEREPPLRQVSARMTHPLDGPPSAFGGAAAAAALDEQSERQHGLAVGVDVPGGRVPGVDVLEEDAAGVVRQAPAVLEHRRLHLRGDLEAGGALEPQHGVPPASDVVAAAVWAELVHGAQLLVDRHLPVRQVAVVAGQAAEEVAAAQVKAVLDVHRV